MGKQEESCGNKRCRGEEGEIMGNLKESWADEGAIGKLVVSCGSWRIHGDSVCVKEKLGNIYES